MERVRLIKILRDISYILNSKRLGYGFCLCLVDLEQVGLITAEESLEVKAFLFNYRGLAQERFRAFSEGQMSDDNYWWFPWFPKEYRIAFIDYLIEQEDVQ